MKKILPVLAIAIVLLGIGVFFVYQRNQQMRRSLVDDATKQELPDIPLSTFSLDEVDTYNIQWSPDHSYGIFLYTIPEHSESGLVIREFIYAVYVNPSSVKDPFVILKTVVNKFDGFGCGYAGCDEALYNNSLALVEFTLDNKHFLLQRPFTNPSEADIYLYSSEAKEIKLSTLDKVAMSTSAHFIPNTNKVIFQDKQLKNIFEYDIENQTVKLIYAIPLNLDDRHEQWGVSSSFSPNRKYIAYWIDRDKKPGTYVVSLKTKRFKFFSMKVLPYWIDDQTISVKTIKSLERGSMEMRPISESRSQVNIGDL
ncbi:MAG: hypothetical protein ABFQ62_00605 [Patescibacteria group bacterium]